MNYNRTHRTIGIALLLCVVLSGPAFAQSYSLSLDSPSGQTFYRTNSVPIEGRLTYGSIGISGALVTIEILNPSDNLFLQTTALTNGSGYFQKSFSIPGGAPIGTYDVSVFCFGERDQSTFSVADTPLEVDPTSWTIGDYGYVLTNSSVGDKVFNLSNSDTTSHQATITHPDFLSFGSNSSGFNVTVPATGSINLVVTDVNTSSEGDYSGDIVITSSAGTLNIPVSMKVRDTLSPDVDVTPASWHLVTYRSSGETESFNVANSGNQGVDVSVSESIDDLTILDDWASSFYLPPDTSRTFRAWANTTLSGRILGNISVNISVDHVSTTNIDVNITITNRPPTVQVDSPDNGSTLVGTSTIEISGDDPDGDPVTYHITLVNATNTANRSTYPGSTYDWPTMSSPEGWYLVIGNATDGEDSVSDSVMVQVIHNRPPTASDPSASDISNSHSFIVESSISDPDGDDVTATLFHREQGSGSWSTKTMSGSAPGTYSATITTSDYSVGDTVEFYVQAEDIPRGATYTTSTSTHTLPNDPPSVGTPSISASDEAHSLDVTASVSDPNGDTVGATLRHRQFAAGTWNTKPMIVGGGTASASISPDDGYAAGQLIEVQVVASDAWTSSTSPINTGLIANAAPEIGEIQEAGGTGHTLEIKAPVTEPDGDELESVTLHFRESGDSYSTKDMTLSGGLFQATIGPSDGLDVDATIEYKIVAADEYGAEDQTPVQTSQLGNAGPSIGQPSNQDSDDQHSFLITFPVSDVDGDSIVSALLFHRIYGTVPWAQKAATVSSGQATVGISLDDGYRPIHTVEYKLEVEDEYGATSTSPSHTHKIPNHGPDFSDIQYSNLSGQHAVSISASITDVDGDSILQALLEHREQGSEEWNTKPMSLSSGVASVNLGTEDGYEPDTPIQYRITSSDQYGASSTSGTQQLSLPNLDPEAGDVGYLGMVGHQLKITSTISDPEGDPLQAVLQHREKGSGSWQQVDMLLSGSQATYTLDTPNGYEPNQRVEFRVLVTDSYGGQGVSLTREANIPNRVPIIQGVTVEDEPGTHNFFVEIDGRDPDGDTLFPTCQYRKVNRTSWYSLPVGERAEIEGELGKTYEVRFKLTDTYDERFSDIITHTAPNSGPSLRIVEPANLSIVNGTQSLNITAYDPEGDRLQFRIFANESLIASSQWHTWITTLYSDGWYNISSSVTDGLLSNSSSIMIQVDNTPVEITSFTGSKKFVKTGDSLTFRANMSDFTGVRSAVLDIDGHNFTLKDDGESSDDQPGDGIFGVTIQIPEIEGGNRTVTLTAKDMANNSVQDQVKICMDHLDPQIHGITTSRNFTSETDPTFNVTLEATDNYAVHNVSFGAYMLNRTGDDTWYGEIIGPITEGLHNFTVQAYDLAGRNASLNFGPLVVDNTDPSLTQANATPTLVQAGDEVQFTIGCQDQLSGILQVSMELVSNMSQEATHLEMDLLDDGQNGDGEAMDGIFGGSFVVNSTLADGNYTCKVMALDRSGNLALDRNAGIIIDNTEPTMDLEFPEGPTYRILVNAEDQNGIEGIEIMINGSLAARSDENSYLWTPDLQELDGHSNMTVVCFDSLNHSTNISLPLWVINGSRVMTGDPEDLRLYLPSQEINIPVQFTGTAFVENLTEENNFTATLEFSRASEWAYTEVPIETNRTILFVARPDGEKVPDEQWWEETRNDQRILCLAENSPSDGPYVVQFQPPPKEGLPISLFLKVLLAALLLGLSFVLVRGQIPGLERREERAPLVPRPLERPPPEEVEEKPAPAEIEAGTEKGLPEEKPAPKPKKPAKKPPRKEKPRRKPQEQVSVPRPGDRKMPKKPHVPARPRVDEKSQPSAFSRFLDKLKSMFQKKKKGGL